MNTVLKPYLSFEDYLAAEELAVEKSEYYAGEIFTMAGGTVNHNRITGNLHFLLKLALKGKPFEVFIENVKLYISAVDTSTYPDILVIQGKPIYWNNRRDIVSNATLIVEVLSNSTEDYDRSGKFRIYRHLPDLTDYILVSQNNVNIEHYTKQSPNQWLLTEYSILEDILELKKFNTQLSLCDIYDNVEFV
jgi:Uma2 family endonuclease